MVFFEKVFLTPSDSILGLTAAFQKDPRSLKVNLGAGVYKNENLQTPVMEAVKQAEIQLLKIERNKDYLPIEGDPKYIDQIGRLVFGDDTWMSQSERIAGFQTPGGTGALSIGSAFLKKEFSPVVYIPNPSWPNHQGVFNAAGLKTELYPYYDFHHHCIEFEKMLTFFLSLPPGSFILFHASCHNPTGEDLSIDQWRILGDLCLHKQFLPFFDCAYQGFGLGIDHDVGPIRLFLDQQIEMVIAVSQSKNFSLYGERVGGLYIVSPNRTASENVKSSVKQVIRTHYSNPPIHGAAVVAMILEDISLRHLWLQELDRMRGRINQVRELLTQTLNGRIQGRDLNYMKQGKGMFCFTGLNPLQAEVMVRDYGIYITGDGRINICGLNSSNIDYVAEALVTVLERVE
jgi:aspartate/tyrosine/aromatic aminotransferase